MVFKSVTSPSWSSIYKSMMLRLRLTYLTTTSQRLFNDHRDVFEHEWILHKDLNCFISVSLLKVNEFLLFGPSFSCNSSFSKLRYCSEWRSCVGSKVMASVVLIECLCVLLSTSGPLCIVLLTHTFCASAWVSGPVSFVWMCLWRQHQEGGSRNARERDSQTQSHSH